MRMSCNGCRVLRKGCSDNCSIRPCLQWIKSPDSQANATVFLAKFYGRAGLINLINAGPDHLRPAIFRSLLYEACGRIVNPIYGSVGLLWSGSWPLCQAAVEAVLKGAPIAQIPCEAVQPFKGCDIRHVIKDAPVVGPPAAAADEELHKVAKATRTHFKRRATTANSVRSRCNPPPTRSHVSDEGEDGSVFSVDTVEGSHVSQGEPARDDEGSARGQEEEEGEVGLDLTLGLGLGLNGTVES